MKTAKLIRQGDVLLIPVAKVPEGCEAIPLENGRIVLMHGEVTGHAHAIADHTAGMAEAKRLAAQAIDLSQSRAKARLLRGKDGIRYLEVFAPVSLKHEEHTAHEIPIGVYEIPVQVEHTTERMLRQVAD